MADLEQIGAAYRTWSGLGSESVVNIGQTPMVRYAVF